MSALLNRLSITTKLIIVSALLLVSVSGMFAYLKYIKVDTLTNIQTDLALTAAARGLVVELSTIYPGFEYRVSSEDDIASVTWKDMPEEMASDPIDHSALISMSKLTIFRVDAGGDLVRIASNAKSATGESPVGTGLRRDSPASQAVLAGESWEGVADVLGVEQVALYVPIKDETGRVVGAIAAVDDNDAIEAEKRELVYEALVTSVVIALVGSLITGLSVRTMLSPLAKMTSAITAVGRRDYDVEIVGHNRGDEIGAMARSLLNCRDGLMDADRLTDIQQRKAAEQARVVADLKTALQHLSQLDLTHRISSPPNDPFPQDYEELRQDFNAAVDSLVQVVTEIQASAEAVTTTAGEFSEVARDLSSRTETQAATLEESAAALDELTASVSSAASAASEADGTMVETKALAENGGDVVSRAIDAMRIIEQSATQITGIIGVMDDIAFQTNLLALNAGVEAARVGDAGRGFAVVASEVRSLAQRSSEAAKDIKRLISQSADQVEAGSQLVNETGSALSDMINQIKQVTQLISNIASSSREQAMGISEVNTGVKHLDVVTQRNAAIVVEASSSAEALNNEAERLAHSISRFRYRSEPGQVVKLRPAAQRQRFAEDTPRPSSRMLENF
jgi:methyl-accepting chemotaxis protein